MIFGKELNNKSSQANQIEWLIKHNFNAIFCNSFHCENIMGNSKLQKYVKNDITYIMRIKIITDYYLRR